MTVQGSRFTALMVVRPRSELNRVCGAIVNEAMSLLESARFPDSRLKYIYLETA